MFYGYLRGALFHSRAPFSDVVNEHNLKSRFLNEGADAGEW